MSRAHRAMCVVDGNGNQCTAGLQSVDVCDAAKQAAQRIANARGESVWLCWESSDDENDVADAYSGNGLEFRPR